MADKDIGEGQAWDQIEECDAEQKELKPTGMETSDIENVLKIARSFFKLGVFDRAFQFADRAHRMIEEKKEGKNEI